MEEITLKEFRKLQEGVPQWEFASKLGYTQAHISSIESNKRSLTKDFLEKLDEIYQYKTKGYTIIESVNKDDYNNMDIHNNNIKNSKFTTQPNGTTEIASVLRMKLDEANEKIIKLQQTVIDLMAERINK
jgi:transcriptional regulator with XRE-family HTH domain